MEMKKRQNNSPKKTLQSKQTSKLKIEQHEHKSFL